MLTGDNGKSEMQEENGYTVQRLKIIWKHQAAYLKRHGKTTPLASL
jgi:hypothetical protein